MKRTHKFLSARLLAWAAAALIIGTACGRVATGPGSASDARSSSPSPVAQSSPSASPAPDPTNWKTYFSSKWGYSIKYPDTWLDVTATGIPDTEKYFSNENAGSPQQLDSSGIYFAIDVNSQTGDACLLRGLRNATVGTQSSLNVDGVTAPFYAVKSEGYGELILNIERSGYCYWFAYIFPSTQVRDETEPTARVMLGQTFRFGQPSAPPTTA